MNVGEQLYNALLVSVSESRENKLNLTSLPAKKKVTYNKTDK